MDTTPHSHPHTAAQQLVLSCCTLPFHGLSLSGTIVRDSARNRLLFMRLGCGLWGVSILHVISFIEIKLHFYRCDVIGDTKQLNMRIIANTEPRHLSVCVRLGRNTAYPPQLFTQLSEQLTA